MICEVKIKQFKCICISNNKAETDKICYLIYPAMASFPEKQLISLSEKYQISLVMIYVPAGDWNNVLTPWPEPGESQGFPPFAGDSKKFLNVLLTEIIPSAETNLKLKDIKERILIGVSLSGLFSLWQWMVCDTFHSIGSLSGSFWYEGFIDWFEKESITSGKGKAFFLLGKDEPDAKIKAYRSVGENTMEIVERLKKEKINVTFEWVPGNHFSDPWPRLELAFQNLFVENP